MMSTGKREKEKREEGGTRFRWKFTRNMKVEREGKASVEQEGRMYDARLGLSHP
jgi:hypothetical protein